MKKIAMIVGMALLTGCVVVEVTNATPMTVIAGARDLVLIQGRLSNPSEEVSPVPQFLVYVDVAGDMVATLSDARLFIDDVQVETNNDPDADICRRIEEGTGVITFIPVNPVSLDPGETLNFKVTIDIAHATTDGTIVQASTCPAAGFGLVEPMLFGPEITVRTHGNLAISTGPNCIGDSLLPGQTPNQSVMVLNLMADYEGGLVDAIPLYAFGLNGGGWDQISQVQIWDPTISTTQPIAVAYPSVRDDWPEQPAPINGGAQPITLQEPLFIPANDWKTLYLKVDTSDCNALQGSIGTSGQGFQLYVPGDEIVARGAQSGCPITAVGQAQSAEFTLFRSVPWNVDLCAPNNTRIDYGMTAGKELCSVEIQAIANDFGLGRMSFLVSWSEGVDCTNFCLQCQGQEIAQAEVDANNILAFDFHVSSRTTIPAGYGKAYEVTADVMLSGPPEEVEYIFIQLLGDEEPVDPLPCTYEQAQSQGRFLWTDFWQTPTMKYAHSEVLTRPQWANGFRVDSLHPISGAVILTSSP